jgi:hypothetical protein
VAAKEQEESRGVSIPNPRYLTFGNTLAEKGGGIPNHKKTAFYVGFTNDLKRRVVEHFEKRGCLDSFTGFMNKEILGCWPPGKSV